MNWARWSVLPKFRIYLVRVPGVRCRQTLECRVPSAVHLLAPILLFLHVLADVDYINQIFSLVVCSPRWIFCGLSGEAVGISSVFNLPHMLRRVARSTWLRTGSVCSVCRAFRLGLNGLNSQYKSAKRLIKIML
jgi:hypothetical protein